MGYNQIEMNFTIFHKQFKLDPCHIFFAVVLIATFMIRVYGLDSHQVADESFEIDRAINALKGEFAWARIGKGGLYLLLIPIYSLAGIVNKDYHFYLLLGRILQVLIGTALILIIFQSLKLLYGNKWTFLFIIPAIFNAQLIYNSHHVNVQNLMFLGVMIHLYLITIHLKQKKFHYLGLSLIPLSVAVASQISAVIITLPFIVLLMAHYIYADTIIQKDLKGIILKYSAISLSIYILMTPGIIFYFGSTAKSILSYLGLSKQLEVVAGTTSSYAVIKNINFWSEYGRYMVNFYGKVNITLIIISSFLIFLKRKWVLLYPLSILVSFFLVFANASQTIYDGRYIIPGLLMGFIIIPFVVVELCGWVGQVKENKRKVLSAIIVLLLAFSFSRNAAFALGYVKQFRLPDTRDLASEWLKKNTSKKDKILMEDSVNFPKAPHSKQALYVDHWNAYPLLDSVDSDYIVINKRALQYLISKGSKTSYHLFYEELMNSTDWKLVFAVKPSTDKYAGPELEIYSRIRSISRRE